MRTVAVCAALLAAAAAAPGRVSVEAVRQHHEAEWRTFAGDLLRGGCAEAGCVIARLMERQKGRDNVSLMRDGMDAALTLARAGRAANDPKLRGIAIELAGEMLRRHVQPTGVILEWDRTTWLEPGEVWRTAPWGTAFRGNLALDVYLEVKDDLTPAGREAWRSRLERVGAFVYRNPVTGSFVFNACIDLCRLLWRLGREFGHPEWSAWALEAARQRIERDVDEEGWIQGEGGGCSGFYQLMGTDLLGRFAWQSRDPLLGKTLRRIFRGAIVPYATPDLKWAGNFGTRSSALTSVHPGIVLVAAALGDPVAGHLARQLGEPSWSGDTELWAAALAAPEERPSYARVKRFGGIESAVVREGPWIAYFANYGRSIWSRGFINLWHAEHKDWLFSTLHSLPSEVAKAKARLGDTSDWSGFPHLRVVRGEKRFDSQQKMTGLELAEKDGVAVVWEEPLLSPEGEPGGHMRTECRFKGGEIETRIELKELAGASSADFHFLRRPESFLGLWAGKEVEDIAAGNLPAAGGEWQSREFRAGRTKLFAVQVDASVFGIELLEAPEEATVTLGMRADSALHTYNLGGYRMRIGVPATRTNYTLRLRMKLLNGGNVASADTGRRAR